MTVPEPNRVWDRGLQPERTALSWRRTGLALGAASLLLARLLASRSGAIALVVATVGITTVIVTLVLVEHRYHSHHRRLHDATGERVRVAGGRLPLVVTVSTVLLGLGAVLAVLLK